MKKSRIIGIVSIAVVAIVVVGILLAIKGNKSGNETFSKKNSVELISPVTTFQGVSYKVKVWAPKDDNGNTSYKWITKKDESNYTFKIGSSVFAFIGNKINLEVVNTTYEPGVNNWSQFKENINKAVDDENAEIKDVKKPEEVKINNIEALKRMVSENDYRINLNGEQIGFSRGYVQILLSAKDNNVKISDIINDDDVKNIINSITIEK